MVVSMTRSHKFILVLNSKLNSDENKKNTRACPVLFSYAHLHFCFQKTSATFLQLLFCENRPKKHTKQVFMSIIRKEETPNSWFGCFHKMWSFPDLTHRTNFRDNVRYILWPEKKVGWGGRESFKVNYIDRVICLI